MSRLKDSGIGARFENIRKELKLSQRALAEVLGVTSGAISQIEGGITHPSFKVLSALASLVPCQVICHLLTGAEHPQMTDAVSIAANIRPIIRLMGDKLDDLPPEGIADDYLAVPLLDGRAAAGPGGVVWERVKGMVWVYRPEVGRAKELIAFRVGGDSMEPTVPSGAIVIIDRGQRQPRFRRRDIWALRSGDGNTLVKRLLAVGKNILLISDNPEYDPIEAWTDDLRQLVIGKVVWMWRSF